MPDLEPFFRCVGRRGGLGMVHRALVEAVGEPLVPVLVRTGLLVRRPLRDGDAYPCEVNAGDGCPRFLVGDPAAGGAVAYCGHTPVQCFPVEVPPEDGFSYRLEPASLAAAVRRALELEGRSPANPGHFEPVDLGVRRVGEESVRFVLLLKPWRLQESQLHHLAATTREPLLVVLAPHSATIPAGSPTSSAGQEIAWLGLEQVLHLQRGRLLGDLSELFLRRPFRGVVLGEALWPRYELVLDPAHARAHWRGRLVDLGRAPRVARLLVQLAEQADALVSRLDMQLDQWPEDFDARSGASVNLPRLDRRLRDLKHKLVSAFEATGHTPAPVETVDSRGDEEGGYRLRIPPSRIYWVSQP